MRKKLALAAITLLALAACSTATTKSVAQPTVKIIDPPSSGLAEQGNRVSLTVEATGVTIVKADGNTGGKTGHYHVFIDRDPVGAGATIPKEASIVHSAVSPIEILGLTVGLHRFVVVLGDGTHARIGTSQSEVSVDVKGPSVDAKAPATIAAGETLNVDVAVQGVTLVAANGDVSGKTGHLHLFVDREVTDPRLPIPKEAGIIHTTSTRIAIPGLGKGEHTIWVVLGNGIHTAFEFPVMDKVTVTVT